MKRIILFSSLLLVFLFGTTSTVKAWSGIDDLIDGRYSVIFLNSPAILGGKSYSLYIDPQHTPFVLWNNELTDDPSYIKWVCATTVETNLIDLARDFGPPRARPNGYFVIPVPTNCDIAAGSHYGVIYMMTDSVLSEGVQANILSFSTAFGDLVEGLLDPYFSVNVSQVGFSAYAAGFADGQNSNTGTAVNALASFVPQVLGVGFGFFLQIASFEVLGVSLLSVVAMMVGLTGLLITLKVATGGR